MKFFVASNSKACASFADKAQCPRIKYFSGNRVIPRQVIPVDFAHNFDEADVLVINGTWGSELRKSLHLEGYDNGAWVDGFIPDIEYEGKDIHYFKRSATLDYINTELVKLAREQKKPVVVFESATISRASLNYNNIFNLKDYSRLGIGSWIYGDAKWLTLEDFEEVRKVNAPRLYDHSWNHTKEGAIYILTGLETDPTSSRHPEDFIKHALENIRSKTNRRICIKIHPISIIESNVLEIIKKYKDVHLIEKEASLQNFYADMYCAVIDNSTSIFELIDAGIPTFCSEVNFGAELNNIDIDNILDPYLASKKEISQWANKMSCTELSKEIILSDDIVTYVEKLVRKYHDGL
jgi:hypothetical protein